MKSLPSQSLPSQSLPSQSLLSQFLPRKFSMSIKSLPFLTSIAFVGFLVFGVLVGQAIADDATALSIAAIQGAAHISPIVGQRDTSVSGIVTDVLDTGFYMQSPTPDGNQATSEGIFVWTRTSPLAEDGTAIALGDEVRVVGTVTEFRPRPRREGQTNTNLSITQIAAAPQTEQSQTGQSETGQSQTGQVTRVSQNNPLPTPIVMGQGGRIPPQETIDDDGMTVFDPENDGLDFYESLEGMRVQVNGAIAVGPSERGEFVVVGDGGSQAQLMTPNGLVIRPGDLNPERIWVVNTVGRTPDVQVGDRFSGPIVGVLGYRNGHYTLFTTQALPSRVATARVPEQTTLVGDGNHLTLASFNVENLDPGDGDRLLQLGRIVADNLKGPDIVALMEIQDNDGSTNSSETSAENTYGALIRAIQAAGGPRYEFVDIAPEDDQDGGQPGGNIRVGFLFRSNRVSLTEGTQGTATQSVEVQRGETGPQLSLNPGRINPTHPAFANSRKSLAAAFQFNGHTLFVVANHFKSKLGDDPLFGRHQPPVLSTEETRTQQASIVHQFVEDLLSVEPEAHVVVMGDLNDFAFSEPIQVLAGDALTNLGDRLPEGDRFSTLFEGNLQQLDHILVSQSLAETGVEAGNAEFDIVHVNAGFSDSTSDHDPMVARFNLPPLSPVSPISLLSTDGTDSEADGRAIANGAFSLNGTDRANGENDEITGTEGDRLEGVETIFPEETGTPLLQHLSTAYQPQKTLSYAQARDILYTQIDNHQGQVEDLYTGFQVPLDPNSSTPRQDAQKQNINTEHVWPQSMGASGPAKTDLHHLFASRSDVNASRGNHPFGDIPDEQTQHWYGANQELSTIPSEDIDTYSEYSNGTFEPRELKKGDVARAMFYFHTLYADRANENFFLRQLDNLCRWQSLDPPDTEEVERSHAIARSPQGNENPFVLDPTLARRTYCQG